MESDKEIAVFSGDVDLGKRKRKRRKSLIAEKFYDFADSTTLHGLRYITQRGLHPVEKMFWIVTIIISVMICFYLMSNVWVKWKTSPVIVSLNEKLVSVDEVPFPSVTICPQNKIVPSIFNFSETVTRFQNFINNKAGYETMFLHDLDLLTATSLICDTGVQIPTKHLLNVSMIDDLLEVTPKFEYIFKSCQWRNALVPCDELFRPILTKEGVCYTMNTLASSEIFRTENLHDDFHYLVATQTSINWTREHGYSDWNSDAYPKRGKKNNNLPELLVILRDNPNDIDELCNSFHSGFKIYLHHPADLPQSPLYYFSALPNQVSFMALKYSVSTSSKNLISIPVDKRQCYFPGERTLRYFQSYSPNNCKMECSTNHTFKKCGCVAFYMPFHFGDKICSMEQMACLMEAQDELRHEDEVRKIERKKKHLFRHTYEEELSLDCNCLPSCYSIDYDAEISRNDHHYKQFLKKSLKSKGYNESITNSLVGNDSYSIIELFYKQSHFMSYKRSKLFGKTDFLANCGGLLGLFLGFSFLSLVEIIYFITLRIWCALARHTQEQKNIN